MSYNIPPIGIDLGTTYSCVGIMLNGKVEIVPNEMGEKLTPSIISFLKKGNLIGEAAQDQLIKNPKNTIYNIKRFIGRHYNDPEIKEDLSLYPFEISNINNIPKIIVNINNNKKEFLPEQISAMILSKLKDNVTKFIKKEIKDAIITVPAYFNDNQRNATKQAGEIAKLNVLRIINEPTAAAIGFGLHKKLKKNEKVLVFDLGGGTFDVSLLELSDDLFEVLGTKGDTHLGGEDFDNLLVGYCIEKFNEEYININLREFPSAMRRLKNACEKCKRNLSYSLESEIDIDSLLIGKSFYTKILRTDFEHLCEPLINQCFEIVNILLKESQTDKKEIKEIILVGGSTKIPKIQEMIKELFMKEPNKNINPDEIVAYGASIYAAILKKIDDVEDLNLILFDVNPMSLGIGSINDKMSFVIPKYQKIPIKVTKTYYTTYDYQSRIKFPVYEGENKITKFNHLLGSFIIYDIPIKKKGDVSFDVTFEIDVNSILTVTAVEKRTKLSQKIVIVDGIANLSKNEIEKYIKECEMLRKQEITNKDLEKIGNIKLKIIFLESQIKSNITKREKISYINKLIEYISQYILSINNVELNNETVLEKTNIYLRKLLTNYNLLLNENNISSEQKQKIISTIRDIFNHIYSNKIQYLLGFIHILESQKEIYYSLKTFLMRLYFNEGFKRFENKEYLIAKYFFLESQKFFQKKEDLIDFKELNIEYDDIMKSSAFYLKRIKIKELMKNANIDYNKAIFISGQLDVELIYTALDKYREALKEIYCYSNEESLDLEYEAKCLSYIIIIQYKVLKTKELDNIHKIGMHCINLVNSFYCNNIQNEKWYIDVKKIVEEIDLKIKNRERSNEGFMEQMKKEKPEIFKEIDEEYRKTHLEFIKFILKKYPYNNYNSNQNIEKEFYNNSIQYLKLLIKNYHPDRYKHTTDKERELYSIIIYISPLLNNIYSKITPNK